MPKINFEDIGEEFFNDFKNYAKNEEIVDIYLKIISSNKPNKEIVEDFTKRFAEKNDIRSFRTISQLRCGDFYELSAEEEKLYLQIKEYKSVVVVGLPGSGKSTTVSRYGDKFTLSLDEITGKIILKYFEKIKQHTLGKDQEDFYRLLETISVHTVLVPFIKEIMKDERCNSFAIDFGGSTQLNPYLVAIVSNTVNGEILFLDVEKKENLARILKDHALNIVKNENKRGGFTTYINKKLEEKGLLENSNNYFKKLYEENECLFIEGNELEFANRVYKDNENIKEIMESLYKDKMEFRKEIISYSNCKQKEMKDKQLGEIFENAQLATEEFDGILVKDCNFIAA